MRYLLFISHGTLAAGMAEALRMLVGEREDVRCAAFLDGMGLPEFKEEIQRVIAPMTEADEVIVMADLVSGSPWQPPCPPLRKSCLWTMSGRWAA